MLAAVIEWCTLFGSVAAMKIYFDVKALSLLIASVSSVELVPAGKARFSNFCRTFRRINSGVRIS